MGKLLKVFIIFLLFILTLYYLNIIGVNTFCGIHNDLQTPINMGCSCIGSTLERDNRTYCTGINISGNKITAKITGSGMNQPPSEQPGAKLETFEVTVEVSTGIKSSAQPVTSGEVTIENRYTEEKSVREVDAAGKAYFLLPRGTYKAYMEGKYTGDRDFVLDSDKTVPLYVIEGLR